VQGEGRKEASDRIKDAFGRRVRKSFDDEERESGRWRCTREKAGSILRAGGATKHQGGLETVCVGRQIKGNNGGGPDPHS